jgi:1-acyl-sn-glycerol-3-phosphate acyltransferase
MSVWRPLRRVWHVARVGFAFLYFWSGGAILSWIYMPLLRWRAPDAAAARRRCQRALHRGWRAYLGFMRRVGLVRFDPRAPALHLPEGPCVIVANHPTLIDVVLTLAVWDGLCTVVKDYYYQLPMVNRLLRYCGHIQGGEEGLGWSADAMEACLSRLRDGHSLLFFPEGTRTPDEGLLPFQRGAFEVARRAGVPVVPLVIHVSHSVLKRGVPWYRVPDRVIEYDLQLLEPRFVVGGRRASIAMARDLRQEMAMALDGTGDVPSGAERGMPPPRTAALS